MGPAAPTRRPVRPPSAQRPTQGPGRRGAGHAQRCGALGRSLRCQAAVACGLRRRRRSGSRRTSCPVPRQLPSGFARCADRPGAPARWPSPSGVGLTAVLSCSCVPTADLAGACLTRGWCAGGAAPRRPSPAQLIGRLCTWVWEAAPRGASKCARGEQGTMQCAAERRAGVGSAVLIVSCQQVKGSCVGGLVGVGGGHSVQPSYCGTGTMGTGKKACRPSASRMTLRFSAKVLRLSPTTRAAWRSTNISTRPSCSVDRPAGAGMFQVWVAAAARLHAHVRPCALGLFARVRLPTCGWLS